jgi:pterin-4a-carbinolamine dehydratase
LSFLILILLLISCKKIEKVSEEIKHHPQWTNNYNKLEIVLWTHDK